MTINFHECDGTETPFVSTIRVHFPRGVGLPDSNLTAHCIPVAYYPDCDLFIVLHQSGPEESRVFVVVDNDDWTAQRREGYSANHVYHIEFHKAYDLVEYIRDETLSYHTDEEVAERVRHYLTLGRWDRVETLAKLVLSR